MEVREMNWGNLISNLMGGSEGAATSEQPMSQGDWSQAVGQATPEQFGRAAYGAITQVPPEEYQQHVTPGAGGTDPIGQLPQAQRSDLASTILNILGNRGIDLSSIAQSAGLGTLNPSQMSPGDLSGLLQWTQQNHPQAFGYAASQYQNQPNILQALLGNPALMSMLGSLGSQFLSNMGQQQPRNNPQNYG